MRISWLLLIFVLLLLNGASCKLTIAQEKTQPTQPEPSLWCHNEDHIHLSGLCKNQWWIKGAA